MREIKDGVDLVGAALVYRCEYSDGSVKYYSFRTKMEFASFLYSEGDHLVSYRRV